ncbi:MAG: hypothetical protein ACT4PT_11625 [Methanobacteriota archaeon]
MRRPRALSPVLLVLLLVGFPAGAQQPPPAPFPPSAYPFPADAVAVARAEVDRIKADMASREREYVVADHADLIIAKGTMRFADDLVRQGYPRIALDQVAAYEARLAYFDIEQALEREGVEDNASRSARILELAARPHADAVNESRRLHEAIRAEGARVSDRRALEYLLTAAVLLATVDNGLSLYHTFATVVATDANPTAVQGVATYGRGMLPILRVADAYVGIARNATGTPGVDREALEALADATPRDAREHIRFPDSWYNVELPRYNDSEETIYRLAIYIAYNASNTFNRHVNVGSSAANAAFLLYTTDRLGVDRIVRGLEKLEGEGYDGLVAREALADTEYYGKVFEDYVRQDREDARIEKDIIGALISVAARQQRAEDTERYLLAAAADPTDLRPFVAAGVLVVLAGVAAAVWSRRRGPGRE